MGSFPSTQPLTTLHQTKTATFLTTKHASTQKKTAMVPNCPHVWVPVERQLTLGEWRFRHLTNP